MSKSLADQFLKAGLVNKKSVHKAKKEKYQQGKAERKGSATVDNTKEERLAAQKAEQIERDKQLNFEREQKRLEKEYQAQVNQLINQHIISANDADIKYNFTDAHTKKVKSMYVTELQQHQLARGLIAIAFNGEKNVLVPRIIADKAVERHEAAVLYIAEVVDDTPDEDDPYKDYQIPDDLMW